MKGEEAERQERERKSDAGGVGIRLERKGRCEQLREE